jgi:hypothetical protein
MLVEIEADAVVTTRVPKKKKAAKPKRRKR